MKLVNSASTKTTSLVSKSVTIVIPCMNKAGDLEKLLAHIEQTFTSIGFTLPVLLIDDGSTDDTPEIMRQLRQAYTFLKFTRHPQSLGSTGAWKTALSQTTTDWILWGSASLESDLRTDIPALLKNCISGVDVIAGWRQEQDSNKSVASTVDNKACRLAFGLNIHDMNGPKLVRRELLTNLPVNLITHRYLLAVLAAQGHNIVETRTSWYPQCSSQGAGQSYRESTPEGERFFTSVIDFTRVLSWCYFLKPIESMMAEATTLMNDIALGARAGYRVFRMHRTLNHNTSEFNLPAMFPPTVSAQVKSSTARAAIVNIGYYRDLALSKVVTE